jgi:uncharacterized membrane protein YhaH (DUF805 family)
LLFYCKRLYLSADGRIGRQDFWIGFAILVAIGVVLGWIPVLGWLISLALCYAQVCLGSKRLHDMGRSGFLMLLPFAVIVVLTVMGMMFGGLAMVAGYGHGGAVGAGAMAGMGILFGLVGLAGFILNIGFLLWMGLTPSQPGENRYGPEPVAAVVTSAAPPVN